MSDSPQAPSWPKGILHGLRNGLLLGGLVLAAVLLLNHQELPGLGRILSRRVFGFRKSFANEAISLDLFNHNDCANLCNVFLFFLDRGRFKEPFEEASFCLLLFESEKRVELGETGCISVVVRDKRYKLRQRSSFIVVGVGRGCRFV